MKGEGGIDRSSTRVFMESHEIAKTTDYKERESQNRLVKARTYRILNILSQFFPVIYRTSSSAETEMPFKTSAP